MFKNLLKEYKAIVDPELESFFAAKIAKAEHIDPSAVEMIKLLRDYTKGGKRVRAAMVYYGYRCFSDKNLDQVVKASMCIELLQSYLLIHDDIIDHSDMRRGKDSLHVSYEKLAKFRFPEYDSKHFGMSMAIIAADILSHLSNEVLTNLKMSATRKVGAIDRANHFIAWVIYGQALDILSGYRNIDAEDLEKIHRYKTAAYTVEGPLHIGAALAGAKPRQFKVLSQYGVPLGKAFQLQDDILGLYGDPKKLGKPVDSDLKEGKKTLLVIKALEKGTKKQKETLEKALGNQNLTKRQLEQVQRIVRDTGSLQYSRDLAKRMIEDAKSVIRKSRFRKPGKDFLLGVADFMLDRDY